MKPLPVMLAGVPKKKQNFIYFTYATQYPKIPIVFNGGSLRVIYFQNGARVEESYTTALSSLSLQADAFSKITLIGDVTPQFGSANAVNCNSMALRSDYITGASYPFFGTAGSSLVSADFSGGKEVTVIDLSHQNQLKSVVLPESDKLLTIKLSDSSNLGSLNLSAVAAGLEELYMENILGVEILDVKAFHNLKKLTLNGCYYLSKMDFSQNPLLEELYLGNTQIAELDLANNLSLKKVGAGGTPISRLDVSMLSGLTNLSLSSCRNLQSLEIGDITTLTFVAISLTNVKRFDFSKNPGITYFDFNNPNAEYLDISSLPASSSWNAQSSEFNLPNHMQTIKCRGNNQTTANTVAKVITNAIATDGVVYTDSTDQYYNTIATAATNKGWTIEPLA